MSSARGSAWAAAVAALLGVSSCGGGDTGPGPEAPGVATVVISGAPATIAAGSAAQLAVTLKDAAGTTLLGRTVAWASSNPAVASVADGLVTGIAEGGPVSISATSEGRNNSVQVIVTPRPIDHLGGSVTSPDGKITLTIPANALTAPADIRIIATPSVTPPDAYLDLSALAATWSLEPHGLRFEQPVTVTLNYSGVVGQISPGNHLAVLHWDAAGTFAEVVSAYEDVTAKTLTFEIEDFSSVSVVQSPWRYTLYRWRWPRDPGATTTVLRVWIQSTALAGDHSELFDPWQDETSGIEFTPSGQGNANIQIHSSRLQFTCSGPTVNDQYTDTCLPGTGLLKSSTDVIHIYPRSSRNGIPQTPNATAIRHAIGHAIGVGNAAGGPFTPPANLIPEEWPVMMGRFFPGGPSGQFARDGLHQVDGDAIRAKYGPLLPPVINLLAPLPMVANGPQQTLTITGARFVSKSAVAVAAPGLPLQVLPANQVTFVSRTELRVTFAPATPGTWTLRVSNPNGQQSGILTFPVASPCHVAELVSKSVQDDTPFAPGHNFGMGWTVRNAGSCTWDSSVKFRYVSKTNGQLSVSQADVPLSAPMAPGAIRQILVPMQAPAGLGTHREEWAVVSGTGATLLGVHAQIVVAAPPVGVPTPLTPVAGAVIRQNDATTGCALHSLQPRLGHGFQIPFSWTPVAGATSYHLVVTGPTQGSPSLDLFTGVSPSHGVVSCAQFTSDTHLTGWTWRVSALVNGVEGAASAPVPFEFALCRLPDNSPCDTTSAPYPTGYWLLDLALASTTITIGGQVAFSVTAENATSAMGGGSMALRGWLVQGTDSTHSGALGFSLIPPGTSINKVYSILAYPGKLVPGPAIARQVLEVAGVKVATIETVVTLIESLPVPGVSITGAVLGANSFGIGAAGPTFDITVGNTTGSSIGNVTLDAWVIQGTSGRIAAHLTTCPSPSGLILPGGCHFTGSLLASNSAGGAGTLIPGPATVFVVLRRRLGVTGTFEVISTFNLPILLQ